MFVAVAVEIASQKVIVASKIERNPTRPVEKGNGKIVIDGNVRRLFDESREEARELDHPLLACPLKGAPNGIAPVDDAGNSISGFCRKASTASIAFANAWPEGHVEKEAIERVQSENLPDLCLHELTVFHVVGADVAVTLTLESAAGHGRSWHDAPFGVVEIGRVVKDDRVVAVNLLAGLAQRRHRFAQPVVPAHGGMRLSNHSRPVAKANVRLAVDHDRIDTRCEVCLDHFARLVEAEQGSIPIWDMHVQ